MKALAAAALLLLITAAAAAAQPSDRPGSNDKKQPGQPPSLSDEYRLGPGDKLRIEVWDSGIGIPEDQQRKIFGEFYQLAPAEPDRRGLGLGLAIVDRLCPLLDHPIELTSRVGKGSRFAVSVPLAPARLTPEHSPATAVDQAMGKLIVVIDDDALVRDGMGGLFRSWGCRVVTGCSDVAALAGLGKRDEC